jgi:cytochrome P450
MRAAAGSQLRWKHFDELFEQIAAGIIFGLDPGSGRPLFDRLGKLMRESNRVFGLKKSKHFDDFYTGIRSQLAEPCAESLVSLCTRVPSTAATRVENQIPHWMFAIRETLAINTVRALALIVSHPEQEKRVRAELVWSDRLTPGVVSNLKYLEGCVQEAMRLWPTTPFLAREVLTADTLDGSSVAPGTQILILNTFNHRDRESIAEADVFCPEQWFERPPDFPFNHLSSGPQVCAGKNLALFISKAVLATLLRAGHYTLRRPRVDPAKPVPSMCNHFRIVFRQR